MAEEKTTFNQLLDIYQQSRKKGLKATLYLDTKDGKEFITFTVGEPVAVSAAEKPSWTPPLGSIKRKSPSQLKRDKRRKEAFNRKKTTEAPGIKVEAGLPASITEPVDEINLETIDEKTKTKVFKIKGEFVNPNRRPWFEIVKDDKEDEHKAFWELIDKGKDKLGIEDSSDGSTYIEHHLEFWGDLVFKPGVTEDHVRNMENWPKGVRNLEIR